MNKTRKNRGFFVHKKSSRKSQVQMMETIAVIFIFFILIIMGLVFYVKVIKSNVQVQEDENAQRNAIKIAKRASTLPELKCTEDQTEVILNCVDLLKLEAASEIILNNEVFYYDRLFFSTITISEIYPDKENWTLYNRTLDSFSNRFVTRIPISLFDPIDNKNAFGVMKVELFLK